MMSAEPINHRRYLEALDRGWAVVPGKPKTKKTYIRWKPFQSRLPSPEEVAVWLDHWPKASPFIITGRCSGIFVVEADGTEGQLSLAACPTALPVTARVLSARGLHYYFQYPELDEGYRIITKAGILPGVDVRGDGGLIVGAGSIHKSGHIYVWDATPEEAGIAVAPDWLLDRVIRAPIKSPKAGEIYVYRMPTGCRDAAYAQGALRNEIVILRNTKPSRRNEQLNKSAFALGRYIGAGILNREDVERELEREAYSIGLDRSEVPATLRSGIEAGMHYPRTAPKSSPLLRVKRNGTELSSENSPENVSAETTGTPAEIGSTLFQDVFMTALAVARDTPEEVDWVVKPWLPLSGLTEIDGKIKGGKTTWAMAMCRAVLDGKPFMGYHTRKSAVVYLTEQATSSFREALRRADLLDRDDFHILFWGKVTHLTWEQRVGIAVQKALEVDAEMLVVDTLAWWAGLRGDAENSSGAAAEAMEPLAAVAANHPIGVMVLRHERKGGGEVGDSGRGSSAFGGTVDIVVSIRRPEGNPGASQNMRVLHAASRYDETPTELMIELTDNGYVAHGDVHAVAFHIAEHAFVSALSGGEMRTMDEILETCKDQGVKRSTLQEAKNKLILEGKVTCTGAGKRGDPFRFSLVYSEESTA